MVVLSATIKTAVFTKEMIVSHVSLLKKLSMILNMRSFTKCPRQTGEMIQAFL